MKIAVMVPHRPHFGNIITQLPLFCSLRERYPDAEITIFSKVKNHQLLIDTGVADKLTIYKKYSLFKLTRALRQQQFDQIYNIYAGSEKVHLATALSKAKTKIGFSDRKWLAMFYDTYLFLKKGNQYISYNNLDTINKVEGTNYKPSIVQNLATPNDIPQAKQRILTIIPCGAGTTKLWDIKNYCTVVLQLLNKLNDIDKVRFVVGPSEKPLIPVILEHLPKERLEIVESPSIAQTVNLALESDLVIGNDCGPMHVFQMIDTPLIMLWGWDNKNHSPFGTMGEWFHARDSAWAITPSEETKGINTIPTDKVFLLANAILSNK